MRLIPRVSLRSVLRAAPACSSGAVFSEQERMEQWNSREGVGNRDAIRLLGILSCGLLSIRIASLFPSVPVSVRLKWSEGQPTQSISAQSGNFFYPIEELGPLESAIVRAHENGGRIVISIDAALAWPSRFVELASMAPRAQHEASFILDDAISNPYLCRETERSACWRIGPSICS